MKTLSAALQAHLDSGATTLAWCWRIERSDGVVFGFTDHDRVLEFGGVSYEPDSGFAASEIRSGADLAVVVDSVEAAQAQMAHERAAQGHLEGKIVLSVMDSSAG